MAFVLDASVALSCASPREATVKSDTLLAAVYRDHAIVPALWLFEVTAVLARSINNGSLTHHEGTAFLRDLQGFDIRVERVLPDSFEILRLALRHQLSGYDTAYLELSLRAGLPLATFDHKLAQAATSIGIKVLS